MGRAAGLFFLLIVGAAGTVAWLVFARAAPAPPAVPAASTPPKASAPGSGAATAPAEGLSTREGRIAFLERMAGPTPPPPGGGNYYPSSAVRADALEALSALPGYDVAPLVLAALGGDGDPGEWGEDRLRAAAMRAARGHADGRETVKAFLREESDLADADGTAAAALAAARMGPEEGGNALRRMMAVEPDDWTDEETFAAVLQGVASLGAGATPEELRRIVTATEDQYDAIVLGAASGALLRLGDESGRAAFEAVREEGLDLEGFARGLGAPGNAAAVPWLSEILLGEDDPFASEAAALALAAVGGDAAKAALRRGLGKGTADAATAVALALLGDSSDLARVRTARDGRDPDLSIPAWRALALLGDGGSREAAERLLAAPGRSSADPLFEAGTRPRVWAALLLLKE